MSPKRQPYGGGHCRPPYAFVRYPPYRRQRQPHQRAPLFEQQQVRIRGNALERVTEQQFRGPVRGA